MVEETVDNDYANYIQQILAPVTDKLKGFSRLELLKSIGALGLLPENASHQIRLEALAHVVAALPESNHKPAPSPHRLRVWLNNPPFNGNPIETAEDPCENAFTEEVTFYGGSYLVIPGRAEEVTFLLRQLAAALFQHSEPIPNAEFIAAAETVIGAALILSNAMLKKAGLRRGVIPVSSRTLFVPDAEQLEILKIAVHFSEDELACIFKTSDHNIAGLAPYVCPPGNPLDSYSIDAGQLLVHPVVMDGKDIVVLIPGALLPAAVNAVLGLAKLFGVLSHVTQNFTGAIWSSVSASLRRIDGDHLPVNLSPKPPIPYFRDGLFSLDSDKITYAALVCDPLDDYEPEVFVQNWDADDVQKRVLNHLREVAAFVYSWPQPPNAIFFLVVLQSLGRSFLVGLTNDTLGRMEELLVLSAADLDILTELDDNEQLKLWKFARAHRKLARQSKIISTGMLNEYAVYKEHSHGYYMSDEERPTMIAFPPGSAGELHRNVIRKLDYHGVPSYERPGTIVDVAAVFGPEIPIYAGLRTLGRRPALIVEAYRIPIWIIAACREESVGIPMFSVHARFVDALAYWLWQFSSSLAVILSPQAVGAGRIIIRVCLVAHESWERANVAFPNPAAAPVEVTANREEGILDVVIQPQMSETLKGADNAGERDLMKSILRGLREIAPSAVASLTEEAIHLLLDKHAELGPKKRLFVLSSQNAPIQNSKGLPAYRALQEGDQQEVLDDLGDRLINTYKYPVGSIPRQKQNEVTKQVVGALYEELERLVATLRPQGLLEWLVSHHERVLVKHDYYKLNLPARMACFSSRSKILHDFLEEAPLQAATGTSARFLLEYITARPPSGLRPMSLSVYDRLQALASQILIFGFVSDMIQYELSDIEITILASRRVAFSKEKFDLAMESYSESLASLQIEQLEDEFAERFAPRERSRENPVADELSAALAAEFDFSLDDFISFSMETVRLGWESTVSGVASLPIDTFIQRLSDRLNWQAERVTRCLDLHLLHPRSNFLVPPGPFTKEDVYPWRYNRALSYLRRPFLRRQSQTGEEVVWGVRMVHTSLDFFVYLCSSGRLRASSLPLKQFLSKLNNKRGAKFNRLVAASMRQHDLLHVRENVKKIPGLIGIRKLGEIDVLVADTRCRKLFVLECKDLAFARTPHEFALELDALFVGIHGKMPIVKRLQLKEEWIKKYLPEILRWMGVNESHNWSTQAAVIVDRQMVAPRLHQSPIPVLTLGQLKEQMENPRGI